MSEEEINREDFVTPFARVLGSYQGVEGKSNGSDRYFSRQQNFVDGIYTGYKYQCVEYARRWLLSRGLQFHSVPFASHIWRVKFLERVSDGKATSIKAVPNGSSTPPIPDSILIWKVAEDVPFGHIAIITDVSVENCYVRIAEQNLDNNYWPGNYARELKLEYTDGGYWIRDEDETYGWMVVNYDVDSQDPSELPNLENPLHRAVIEKDISLQECLDPNDLLEQKYLELYGDRYLHMQNMPYYTIEAFMAYKIQYATMEYSFMCIMSASHIAESDELLEQFGVPKWAWPHIRDSLNKFWTSNGKYITYRNDFGIKGQTLKVLGISDDCMLGLFEAAVLQDKILKKFSGDDSKSTGLDMYSTLLTQCKDAFKDFVHISVLEDQKPECEFLTMFIEKVLKDINVGHKVIRGTQFKKRDDGKFVDLDGQEINCVWKLYPWEVIFEEYEKPRDGDNLKLSDLLVNDTVRVLEPIWKILFSSKGLVGILNKIFPKHAYALHASFNEEDMKGPYDSYPYKLCFSGKQDDGPRVFIEKFKIEDFDGHKPLITSWTLGRNLTGSSVTEVGPDSSVKHVITCARLVNE